MNDINTDLAHGQGDETPHVGAEAATLVPVVAEADGQPGVVANLLDGDDDTPDEVVGYVQTEEDA